MMNFAFKMMNFAFKMMNFVFKMMSFGRCDACPLDPMKFEDFVEGGIPSSVYRAKGLLWLV